MANLNEEKVFYKIPYGWNFTGKGEVGGIKQRKLYAAFLYFKGINRFGRFTIQEAYGHNRDKANYWIRKVVAAGWATKMGDTYFLKSYQAVWEIMGIQKVTKKRTGKQFYKYEKYQVINGVIDFQLEGLLDKIQKQCAKEKSRQLRFRLSNGVDRKKRVLLKPEFSGEAAKLLFGYKSGASGLKYRKKYFVTEQPEGRRLWVNPTTGAICSLFFCALIYV